MFAGRYFATGYWPKAYWPGVAAPIEVSPPAIHGGTLRYEFPDHAADRITRRDIDEITIILAALEDLGYL